MQQDNSSFWTDIKTFEEQLAKSPNSFCFARLSDVYLKVGLVDDALHTARQGVAKHPGYLGGQRALAMACHAKGLNDECLTALKHVTVAMPEDHQAQKLLGRLLADSGDKDAARQVFQTVLEFVPDDVESRIGLESLEFSGDPAPCGNEDDEEIIEDLELLEELDVFEEDQADSDLISGQEQLPVAAEPAAEAHHDPLSTGTLAEMYVKQGFIHKALEIYRSIMSDEPGNSAVAARVAELELLDAAASKPEPVCDDAFAFEPDEAAATGFEMDTAPLDNVFAVVPEPGAAVKPQGVADNALSTLEGWLENIRRVKSCR